MDVAPTGNGRRELRTSSNACMTNTFMEPGDATQGDMIRSVDRGIFAVNFGGGQVDITSGQFVFAASEAYLIEKGKVTAPVKGATLIGHGPEAMSAISMIGDDLALDPGIGVCGKNGQSVPCRGRSAESQDRPSDGRRNGLMGDSLIERAIQTPCLTFVFVQFSRLLGSANQLVQSLRIGGKFIKKIGCLFRVIQQAVAPLFGLMMLTLFFVGIGFIAFNCA